jgi:hypothetical protein
VNVQQPQESKLLVKALTAHDPQTRQAPLNGKQLAAYHSIEEWVQTTLASNPHLRERGPQPPAPVAALPPEPKAGPVAPAVSARPTPAPAVRPPSADFAAARPAQAAPVDEFDPALFNRQGQPDDKDKR